MAKATDSAAIEKESFEIIELAIDDINTLTRAFEVISQVCEELNHPNIRLDESPAKQRVN